MTALERCYEALLRLGLDGWPVTVREIQTELGYRSTSDPHRLLHQLEQVGRARRHPRNVAGGWRAAA